MKRIDKKLLLLIIIAFLFSLLFLNSEKLAIIIETKIIVINNNINLGNYTNNNIVKHSFKIYNISFETRKINNISVDCVCSKMVNYPKELKPFKIYTIDIEAKTKNYNGPQQRNVLLRLSDLKEPILLQMRYNIEN